MDEVLFEDGARPPRTPVEASRHADDAARVRRDGRINGMACGHDALEQRLTVFAHCLFTLAWFGHLKGGAVWVAQHHVEAFTSRERDVEHLELGVFPQPMKQGRRSLSDLL